MLTEYRALLEEIRAMIPEAGRQVVLRNQASGKASDRPWRGPASSDYEDEPVAALFMPLEAQDANDQLVSRGEQVAYVAPSQSLGDLKRFDQVIDEGVTWRVEQVQEYKPGPVTLLYVFGLSR